MRPRVLHVPCEVARPAGRLCVPRGRLSAEQAAVGQQRQLREKLGTGISQGGAASPGRACCGEWTSGVKRSARASLCASGSRPGIVACERECHAQRSLHAQQVCGRAACIRVRVTLLVR